MRADVREVLARWRVGPAIPDLRGHTDHRGRQYPITGCRCLACYTAALLWGTGLR